MPNSRPPSHTGIHSDTSGFSLPEVLVALLITGLFVAVLVPIMRDTLFYAGRLTDRLPMARTLQSALTIDRLDLSNPKASPAMAANGLTIVRSMKQMPLSKSPLSGEPPAWRPVMVTVRVESPTGLQMSSDIVMLRKATP